jgi:uncharacterized delta-60 repeat protein
MHGYAMVRRWSVRVLAVTAAAATGVLLLAFASPALAGQVGIVHGSWSLNAIKQGVGEVPIVHGRVRRPPFTRTIDLGPTPFNFTEDPVPGRAVDWFDETSDSYFLQADAPSIASDRPLVIKGGHTHVEYYAAFEKGARDGLLEFQLNNVILNMTDANGPLSPSECQAPPCDPIQTVVRYQARAWTVAGGHEFFDAGGTVLAQGHDQEWFVGEATAADAQAPFWTDAQFSIHKPGGATAFNMRNEHSIDVDVPLKRLHRGTLFMTKVSIDVRAIDDRGGESAADAFASDPPHLGPGVVVARGLTRRHVQNLKEPPLTPRPAAQCHTGPRLRAGTVQLSSRPLTAGEGSGDALVLVTRTGGSRGATSVIVKTTGGTAQPGADFKPTRTRVRFENGETSPRLVEVPIREDLAAESPESFTLSLSDIRCAKLGKQRSATVTILDDDQPPLPPPPTFTLGGTVDGLQGSGLVLSNLGAELPVSANGNFTFPGTATGGQTYEVNVKIQPSNPDQLCSVDHGSGQVGSANVTNIAVHCQTATVPSGLDLTFGGGRVSTPVGGNGEGQAVVIQPSGRIVTAGWRTVGLGIDTDFALTRHNPDGSLDTGFGTGGIATTDLGGPDDQAFDAALLPDNGIVAVGRTDALGILKTEFGVVRYLPDGAPNPNFDADGIVTTPFFGKGAGANAVAVQPDGKILVAGFADEASAFNSDFALARYNSDGTLDTSFDGDGIVTTDLSGQDDDARAVVIQPDGRIVVAGTAGEDIAVARYMPDGKLDNGFGSGGFRITDLGFVDVANGVALTPSGQILLVGYTIGAKLNNDFLLARYNSNGTLDATFGTGGTVKTDISGADDFAEDLVVDAAGRIIVVGRATSATILDMALVRYKPDGTPDTSFDGDGTLTADFHGRGDLGQDVALDAQGRIVAAGYTADGSGTEFALMRVNP